ncbi:MAG: PEP-CTERM sorting domain-containing protein [Planctomycetia bacterium]
MFLSGAVSVVRLNIQRNTTFTGQQFTLNTTGTAITLSPNITATFNTPFNMAAGNYALGDGSTLTFNNSSGNPVTGGVFRLTNATINYNTAVVNSSAPSYYGTGALNFSGSTSGNNFKFNVFDSVNLAIKSMSTGATSGTGTTNYVEYFGSGGLTLERDFQMMASGTTNSTISNQRNAISLTGTAANQVVTVSGPYTARVDQLFFSNNYDSTLRLNGATVQVGDGSANAQGLFIANSGVSPTAGSTYGQATSLTSGRTYTIDSASTGTLRINGTTAFNLSTAASGSSFAGALVRLTGSTTLVNNGPWINRNFANATVAAGLDIGTSATLSGTGSFDMTTGYTGAGATGIGKSVAIDGIVAPGDVVGGVNGVGTLTIASGTVSFGAASKVAISGSGATLDQLVLNAPVSVTSGAKVDFAATSNLTLGRYQVVTGSSGVNTFTATNAPAAYTFGTSGTDAYLWAKPVFGTISTTPAAAQVITGGTVAFTYTVQNSAPTGGQNLAFTSAAGSGIVGTVLGTTTVAPQATSGTVSGFSFVGGTPGLAQAATFTVSDPNALATSATGTVALNVLDHATPGFATAAGLAVLNPLTTGTILLDFGSLDVSAGAQSLTYSLTNIASQTYGASLTAGLALTAFTGNGDGFTSGLSAFADLLAGGTSSLLTAQFTPSTEGSFSRSYTLTFYDNQSVAGSTQRRDLTVNMQAVVVPEPGALALAGVGVIIAGWRLSRQRPCGRSCSTRP